MPSGRQNAWQSVLARWTRPWKFEVEAVGSARSSVALQQVLKELENEKETRQAKGRATRAKRVMNRAKDLE